MLNSFIILLMSINNFFFIFKVYNKPELWGPSYASAKTLEREGSILSSSFCGQLADYYLHVFSLIHPLDEFFLKEMRTWSQSKILSCGPCVWCKSRELRDKRSPRFPTLPAIKSHWEESHLELFILLWRNLRASFITSLLSWAAAWLLVRRIWPVYLVDELVLGVI